MTSAAEPNRLARTQIREVGQVIARAFDDDPVARYIHPDGAIRARELEWFFTAAARYGHMYGDEVYATEGKVDGAAIWLRPGDFPL
jgi:hypothetical protein